MKVFLSYVTQHKKIAGQIKIVLDELGFECFLAHENIQPTENWVRRILRELAECDVFVPILTNGAENSMWVNQEIGIALAKKKTIVPLKIDSDPKGFILTVQALRFNPAKDFPIAEMVKTIHAKKNFRDKIRKMVVEYFGNSYSFAETEKRVDLLVTLGRYSKKEMRRVLKLSMSNNQIYNSWKAQQVLPNFVSKHHYDFDWKLMKKFKGKMG